jgi:hypothetical protein
MFCAAEFRKLPFKLGDLRPQDELAMLQYAGDGSLNTVADLLALCSQVDEGWDKPFAVFAHAIPY